MPLKYPDKVLVGAKVTNIEEDRFTMRHRVVSTKHQRVAAEGEGLIVTFDYQAGKKVSMPGDLRQRILHLEGTAIGQ